MSVRVSNLTIGLSLLLTVALAHHAQAQEPRQAGGGPSAASAQELDAARTEERIKALEAQTDGDLAARDRLLGGYRNLRDLRGTAAQWKQRSGDLARELETAPSLTAELRSQIAAEVPGAPPVPPETPVAELEVLLGTASAEAEAVRQRLELFEQQLAGRNEQRLALSRRSTELKESIRQLGLDAAAPVEGNDGPEAAALTTMVRKARLEAAQAELARVEAELGGDEALGNLLVARRDLAARDRTRADKRVQELRQLVDERRRLEAESARLAAERQALAALPELAAIAEANVQLAVDRTRVAREFERASQSELELRQELESQEDRFEETKRKVDAAGLTEAIGIHLRRERVAVALARRIHQRPRVGRGQLAAVQLELIELEPQRVASLDVEPWVEALVESSRTQGAAAELLREEATQLGIARRDLLQALKADDERYFAMLVNLDTSERDLRQVLEEYAAYIGERVLWVRSAQPLWNSPLQPIRNSLRWLVDGDNWAASARAVEADFARNPARLVFGLFAVLGLILVKPKAKRAIRASAAEAEDRNQVSIRPTFVALAWTIVRAAAVPAALALLGWCLSYSEELVAFPSNLADGLLRAALIYLTFDILRRICGRDGLGRAHLGWPEAKVRRVRLRATTMLFVLPAASFVVTLLAGQDPSKWKDSLGRIIFLVELLFLLRFARVLLGGERGVIDRATARRSTDWLARLRLLWYVLAIVALVGLASLAVLGWFFTARQLATELETTFAFFLVLVMAQGIALRWVLLVRRRLAQQQLEQRRRDAAGKEASAKDEESIPVAVETLNVSSLSLEIRQLVRTLAGLSALVGVFAIWYDVLPAFGLFDEYPLWTHTAQVRETGIDEAGLPVTRTVDTLVATTLADLFKAMLMGALFVLAVRNVPALLEITLLRRLSVPAGERYAITGLTRYLIVIIGIVVAFRQIGIGWSEVQWLAAGVSVGLGFGLQEFFANFISGITLLFERPIRVGDWVTIGGIEGVVSRIRIRATTITDRDRKELVVPNREFITGQLINWTLSDPVTRVVIPVGIAYGSDTDLAVKTLHGVGRSSHFALEDPSPNVYFLGFGESSLDFELRVFVMGRDVLPKVLHDLHMRVDRAFRAAGIEIAFPQRDLHVRSAPALESMLRPGTTFDAPPGGAPAEA